MSILTRVLIGLVVVAVFPMLYFTAAVLKVQQQWRWKFDEFQAAVERQTEANDNLLNGDAANRVRQYDPSQPTSGQVGVKQLEKARDNLMLGRGRFWYAERVSTDPATGATVIRIVDDEFDANQRAEVKSHNIKDKTFLYAFNLKHNGALPTASEQGYLGEFIVDGLQVDATTQEPASGELPLRPAQPQNAKDLQDLASAGKEWIVYEKMPTDDHDVFSDVEEAKIGGVVPQSVLAEYLSDGKQPTAEILGNEKLAAHVVDDSVTGKKKFVRPLRDYQQIFRNAALRLAEMNDRLAVLNSERAFAKESHEKLMALNTKLDGRKAELDAEKQTLLAEYAVIQAHHDKLAMALAKVEQDLQAKLAENRALGEAAASRGRTAATFDPLKAAALTE